MLSQLELKHHLVRVMREPTIPLTRVTMLAGPNGAGKSTVLDALQELILNPSRKQWTRESAPILVEGDCKAVYCLNFEKDNPRTVDPQYLPGASYGAALLSRFKSHGQSNYKLLCESFDSDLFDVMVLDEPECALDLDGLITLRQRLMSTSKQIILATHSPMLLSLYASEGVSVQVFGPEPDYMHRVLRTYRDATMLGAIEEAMPRLRLDPEMEAAGGQKKSGRRSTPKGLTSREPRPLERQ